MEDDPWEYQWNIVEGPRRLQLHLLAAAVKMTRIMTFICWMSWQMSRSSLVISTENISLKDAGVWLRTWQPKLTMSPEEAKANHGKYKRIHHTCMINEKYFQWEEAKLSSIVKTRTRDREGGKSCQRLQMELWWIICWLYLIKLNDWNISIM